MRSRVGLAPYPLFDAPGFPMASKVLEQVWRS
jgi:hypothetical protein